MRYKIDLDDDALVYTEEHCKWVGSYKVQRNDCKCFLVTDGTKNQPNNMTHVLPANSENRGLQMNRLLEDLNDIQSAPSYTLQNFCIRVTNVLRVI